MPSSIGMSLPEVRSAIMRLEARKRVTRLTADEHAELERLQNVEACRLARLPAQIDAAEAKLARLREQLTA